MHSIRTKIMAVTIAAIVTSILALGGIGILTIGLESDRNAAEKMKLISENMQMKLNTYLDSLQQSVDTAIFIARESLERPERFAAKVLYRQDACPCTVEQTGDRSIRVIFDEPQRACAPGQAAVVYDGDIVICGGTIA
jgi:tRNA U34 2-thiouridine synthase MnmA/TrmU